MYRRPFIIAGPCSAERREQLLSTCVALATSGKVDMLRAGVWKPRTMPDSFEGVGEEALKWLAEAKQLTGLPVCTEVATPQHLELALRYGIDAVWLGARTTVNPFSVQAIADALDGTEVGVMLKNPLVPSVDLWDGALERIAARVAPERIALIHRGFATENESLYRFDPMWNLAIEMRRRHPETTMLCDPSHLSGRRERVEEILRRAADLGYGGAMVECHINPDEALSDSRQQLRPDEFEVLLGKIVWRTASLDATRYTETIENCRAEIDAIDNRIFDLLAERMKVSDRIGEIKLAENVAVLQESRWSAMLDRLKEVAERTGLPEEFLRRLLETVHLESIARQERLSKR